MAKLIQLTKGKLATVDDADFDWLSKYRWHLQSAGYAARREGTGNGNRGKIVLMHRVILGIPSGLRGDHIDGDKLNNTRANLRIATAQENNRNRKPLEGSSSHFKGVCWNRQVGKWRAQIMVARRTRTIGDYATELQAAAAYDTEARRLFGPFAWLNFPERQVA